MSDFWKIRSRLIILCEKTNTNTNTKTETNTIEWFSGHWMTIERHWLRSGDEWTSFMERRRWLVIFQEKSKLIDQLLGKRKRSNDFLGKLETMKRHTRKIEDYWWPFRKSSEIKQPMEEVKIIECFGKPRTNEQFREKTNTIKRFLQKRRRPNEWREKRKMIERYLENREIVEWLIRKCE